MDQLRRMYWELAGVDPDDEQAIHEEERELGKLVAALLGVVVLTAAALMVMGAFI